MPDRSQTPAIPRRRFVRNAVTAATAACVSSNVLVGCVGRSGATTNRTYADPMDQALDMMSGLAPLTNHGPMAAEALVALSRAEVVVSFVESYKKRFTSAYPAHHQTLTRKNWREALGDGNRVADWTDFFNRELKEASWTRVVEEWSSVLAPGLAAAAAHGLIRTAHAVRSLSSKETELRRRELAEGLGYWAAYYQSLPEAQKHGSASLNSSQAINMVPLLPDDKRPSSGSIMIALRSLNEFTPFAHVANLLDLTRNAPQVLSEITETFATAYIRNVNQRNFITLLHSVTATTSLRSLLPHLSPDTTQRVLRYGWQIASGLYSISAIGSTNHTAQTKPIIQNDLVERAVSLREEHAIKFTEACVREYAINRNPVYLQAAHDCVERIGRVVGSRSGIDAF
jgi:hypothetical protein